MFNDQRSSGEKWAWIPILAMENHLELNIADKRVDFTNQIKPSQTNEEPVPNSKNLRAARCTQ